MDKRELFLFLNAIGLSSRNILLLTEGLEKENLDWKMVYQEKFLEKIKLYSKVKERILKNSVQVDTILEKIYAHMSRLQIDANFIFDEDFPQRLREIEDPPALLYFRGKPWELENTLAFVGARKHSAYGEIVVKQLIKELSPYDFSIVSGMAYGIDALSHREALKNELKTIAVLGTGIDVVYPKTNIHLYEELKEQGTLVSEFPFGSGPHAYHFPIRNRIISGISKAVVVVEAQEKSGSLITARLAAEQGREIYAVPGNINSPFSGGTNQLIRDGARPLLEIQDILDAFPNMKPVIMETKEEQNLTKEEQVVYNLIEVGKKSINEICNHCDFEVSYINSLLTMLELKGVIEKVSMNEFEII